MAEIQKRIDVEADEKARLAHVKDREIVRHYFAVAKLPAPAIRRRFIVGATGGCMMHTDGAVAVGV